MADDDEDFKPARNPDGTVRMFSGTGGSDTDAEATAYMADRGQTLSGDSLESAFTRGPSQSSGSGTYQYDPEPDYKYAGMGDTSGFTYEDDATSGYGRSGSSTSAVTPPGVAKPAQQKLGDNQGRTASGDIYDIINPQYQGTRAEDVKNFGWAPKYPGSGTGGTATKYTGGGKITQSALRQPYANVSTRKTVSQGVAPTYTPPVYNESEIKKLRRKAAAPAIRALERGVRQVANQYYENPNVKAMVLGKSLAGYGIGLGSAIQGAERAAQQEYGATYAREERNSLLAYEQAMNLYRQNQTAITSTVPVYSKSEYDKVVSGGGGGWV